MSAALQLGIARLRRRPAQSATQTLVLALAVALLGSMILFIGHSLRTMTACGDPQRAARPAGPGGQLRAGTLAGQRGCQAARHRPGLRRGDGSVHRRQPSRRRRGHRRRAPARSSRCRPATCAASTRSASCAAACGPADRARPAARGDVEGQGRRLGHPPPRRPRAAAELHGRRRRSRHRSRRALPAAQPPARPGAVAAARQHRDPPGRTFSRTIGRALPSLGSASPSRRRSRGAIGVQWQVQAQVDREASADPRAKPSGAPGRSATRWNGPSRGRSSSSTTSPKRSNRRPGTPSTPRRFSSCSPFQARCWRSASPTWRRWERWIAIAANSPSFAPAARAAVSCSAWRRPNRASSACSPACSAPGSPLARSRC